MDGGADDPLKKLADALDDALDRLAAGYEGQRRFAANASHELRTPLAVQRLLTEVALDDPDASQDVRHLGAHLLRANERNERLIEGLLVLAEADRGLPGLVPVRLDELAGSVIESHQEHGPPSTDVSPAWQAHRAGGPRRSVAARAAAVATW